MFLNTFLALSSLFLLVITFTLLILHKKNHSIIKEIEHNIFNISIFFVAFLGTLFPLIYQYYYLYPPCMLCWYQRIFMFPIFIASLYALTRKRFENLYSLFIVYATTGLLFSIYHYMVQMQITGEGSLCTTASNSVACTTVEVLEFGFISIPFMAGSAFLAILILSYIAKNRNV